MMNDLISRKWLMECIDEGWVEFDTEKDKNTYIHLVRDIAPPAQTEPLTDEERRIFLAAMGREEKVCKHVDKVYGTQYEDGLLLVCREIERKVKKALWTS